MVTITNQKAWTMLWKGVSSLTITTSPGADQGIPESLRYAPLPTMPTFMSSGFPAGYHSPPSANQMSVPNRPQPRKMKKHMSDRAGADSSMTRMKSVKASLYLPSLKTRKMRVRRSILNATSAPPCVSSPEITSIQNGAMAKRSIKLLGLRICLSILLEVLSSWRLGPSLFAFRKSELMLEALLKTDGLPDLVRVMAGCQLFVMATMTKLSSRSSKRT
mmetsp:Transcript_71274/g.115015  ORF Transcript_71274/g.115015 Transcript_71274/m.115015 type:complete len:218 (+) Transcript_71274:1018-1671(+)